MKGSIPPNAFVMIIGAMKCGTSSLFEYLRGHPQVCASIEKEPMYFAKSMLPGLNVKYYEELFHFDFDKHKYALEASTPYSKFPEEKNVAKRIKNYGLDPKFIYIVRDPLERVESQFRFEERSPGYNGLPIYHPYFTNYSDYYLQLSQYLPYFPMEDFLILDFKELKSDPDSVLNKTCRFLGIQESYRPNTFVIVNETRIKTNLEKSIQKGIPGFLKIVPQGIKDSGRNAFRRIVKPKARKLSEMERKQIKDRLYPGIVKFGREFDFDVAQWGFN